MRTLLPDPPPAEFERLLERRRAWGADTHDEVWEGLYRIMPNPAGRHGVIQKQLAVLLDPLARTRGLEAVLEFNLGDADDYRVPDGGLHHRWRDQLYYSTAALVVEILSPGDDAYEKLPFYAAHAVEELLVVDPVGRTVDWLALAGGGERYEAVQHSRLIDLGPGELADRIDWPVAEAP